MAPRRAKAGKIAMGRGRLPPAGYWIVIVPVMLGWIVQW